MASESSFDIISKIDLQEVDNAIQQALKEIRQRYDFKGSLADIRRENEVLHLTADDDYKLKALTEILTQRLAGRRVPLKGLTFKTPEQATGGSLRQEVTLQQGIPQEQAKEIVKILKSSNLKVQASIQADQVRVRGKSRDDLQAAIRILKESPLPIDMQFTNYR
ncbi:MAG TPA: YajQ family cyclic di-GMP-binding protein [Candidatus Polarisedimenticolia bacterium]|nr:YajQ family cyclic di-GMP-binding protein [Candidatus Polarisedimenticolia bacterium]